MSTETESSQGGTHSIRMLKLMAEQGRSVFTTAEARKMAELSGIPRGYVTNLLMLMIRSGWITRLKRGLYACSGPALGESQIHPFTIATQIVTPSAISHWSALRPHGLTEQIPRVITTFTPKKVVTPSMRRSSDDSRRRHRHAWTIEGIRYEYMTVKKDYFFGIEEFWVDEFSKVPITDKERTTLEVFVSPRVLGGMGEAMGIIENHLKSLSVEKLVDYARRYGKISISKRLGWVLERFGVYEHFLTPLLKIPATGYHALDPSRPHKGPCNRKWMIQNNFTEEDIH
ncbi:MAG: type IV toxin-antitoxin system AbiEi family antitoxin domain-containing protein [Deltaproteobacteria bacterium]|nr:type IV toxin-antitoxin system AbiEi family antitoxin domain-containing protein [Deltaproteobacteria bacterium]